MPKRPQIFDALSGDSFRVWVILEYFHGKPLVISDICYRLCNRAVVNISHSRAVKIRVVDVDVADVFGPDRANNIGDRRRFRAHRLNVKLNFKVGMIDLMYQLPEEPKPAKYVITRDIVEGKADLFTAKQRPKRESA